MGKTVGDTSSSSSITSSIMRASHQGGSLLVMTKACAIFSNRFLPSSSCGQPGVTAMACIVLGVSGTASDQRTPGKVSHIMICAFSFDSLWVLIPCIEWFQLNSESFPTEIRNKTKTFALYSFSVELEVLARTVRLEKEIKGIHVGKGEVRDSLCIADTILSIRDPMRHTRKLLELVSTSAKVVGY